MDKLLAALTEHFAFVIIDTPPLLMVTDAAVMSKKTRGAILVAASGSTKKQELEGAVRTLDAAGAHVLGVVVTMLPTKGPDSYGYGTYGYGLAPEPEPSLLDDSPRPTTGATKTRLRRR